MAEWSNAVDSKSIVLGNGYLGFESLSLRHKKACKSRLFVYLIVRFLSLIVFLSDRIMEGSVFCPEPQNLFRRGNKLNY